MKKLFFFVIFGTFILSVHAQSAWELSGNGNVSSSNFLGTTIRDVPLIFKTNNIERMRLLPDKPSLGIGTPTPNALLHLHYDGAGVGELINFLHLTATSSAGPSAEFRVFSLAKNIYLKQNLQADFVIEGHSGGLKITPNGSVVFDGNILADTVKINKSILLPENKLTFTRYTSTKDGDDGDGLPPDPEQPQLNPVATMMTLQYVNNGTRLGVGGFSSLHNFFVSGTGMISNRLTLKSTSSIPDQFSDLGLQIGNSWTFFDMSNAKIMGYNSLFKDNAPPTRYTNGAASAMMMNTNGSIQLCTAPTGSGDLSWNYFTMLNNGNVGIGTSDPAKQLHVQGDSYLSGKVGIGTSEPAKQLHVQGDSYLSGKVGIGTSDPAKQLHVQGDSYLNGKVGIGIEKPEFPLDVNGDANFKNAHTNNIYFPGNEMRIIHINDLSVDATKDIMTFNNSGNVGIGTTIPEKRLHVQGDTYLDGKLGIGISNPEKKLHVQGDSYFNGNVGIGINSPEAKLHVNEGALRIGLSTSATDREINVINIGDGDYVKIGEWEADNMLSFKANKYNFTNGNVGIGIADPAKKLHVQGDTYVSGSLCIGTTNNKDYKLAVKGIIGAEKVILENARDWPDYVFELDYDLMSIGELEEFIAENKHLPNMPNKEEVGKNGQDVGEINRLLLEKIEELTLYIIQQQKEIDELKRR